MNEAVKHAHFNTAAQCQWRSASSERLQPLIDLVSPLTGRGSKQRVSDVSRADIHRVRVRVRVRVRAPPGSQVRARSNAAGPHPNLGFGFPPGFPGSSRVRFISHNQRTKQAGRVGFLVCHSDILNLQTGLCFCVFVFCSPTSINIALIYLGTLLYLSLSYTCRVSHQLSTYPYIRIR